MAMSQSKKKKYSPHLEKYPTCKMDWMQAKVGTDLGTAVSSENSWPKLRWDLNMLHPNCLSSGTYRWYKMYFSGICGLLQSQATFSLLTECFITSNWELLTPYLLWSWPHTETRNHPDMTCHKIICDISLSKSENAGKHEVKWSGWIQGLKKKSILMYFISHIFAQGNYILLILYSRGPWVSTILLSFSQLSFEFSRSFLSILRYLSEGLSRYSAKKKYPVQIMHYGYNYYLKEQEAEIHNF